MWNVLLLSTTDFILGTTKDDNKSKPAVYKYYDFNKTGTDVIDQRMDKYSVKAKSKKWTRCALSYILDSCRVNAQTILAFHQGKMPRNTDSFQFGWALALALVQPHVARRSRYGQTMSTQAKMNIILGRFNCETGATNYGDNQNVYPYPSEDSNKQRCKICYDATHREGHKKQKDNMGKTKTRCHKCNIAVCREHLHVVCHKCS